MSRLTLLLLKNVQFSLLSCQLLLELTAKWTTLSGNELTQRLKITFRRSGIRRKLTGLEGHLCEAVRQEEGSPRSAADVLTIIEQNYQRVRESFPSFLTG